MAVTIPIDEWTKGSIVKGAWVGTGAFDILMDAVSKNIQIQYDAGRINGNDYALVYTKMMEVVIAQSKDWAMNIDNSQAQADLTYEQVKGAYAKRVGEDKEVALKGLDNVVKNAELERAVNPNMVYTPRYEV